MSTEANGFSSAETAYDAVHHTDTSQIPDFDSMTCLLLNIWNFKAPTCGSDRELNPRMGALVAILLAAWPTNAGSARAEVPRGCDHTISPRDHVISLINGPSLDGLYTWLEDTHYDDPRQVFRRFAGLLHVSGDGYGGLLTTQRYRDYHLILEYKWGGKTWKARKQRARDSGLLIHSSGADGAFAGRWMPAIEVQIIEGGVGDLLLVPGNDSAGKPVPLSLTSRVRLDQDGEFVWCPLGEAHTFDLKHNKRVNWCGRDPDWEDVLGYRGAEDVDSRLGEWTRLEVRCEADKVTVFVNGVKVNEAVDVYPSEGRLQLQSELAEIIVRRWELWPLAQAPTPRHPQQDDLPRRASENNP